MKHRLSWLLALALVEVVACTTATTPRPQDATGQASIEVTLRCADCLTLTVDRIIDGDTFDSPTGRVRLFGVDTPERGEPCFTDATERLRLLAGDRVRVEAGPRSEDSFGRLLYYAFTLVGDSMTPL